RLLAAVQEVAPQWHAMIFTLATTGARWGEASALRWSDIDFDRGSITIAIAHCRGEVKDTKTGIIRTVPLTRELAEVLRAHRAQLMREQAPGFSDGWVFPSATGGLSQPNSSYKALNAASKRAGLS